MSYFELVLDLEDDTVPPGVLRKIIELVRSGGTVVSGSGGLRSAWLNRLSSVRRGSPQTGRPIVGSADEAAGARTFGEGTVVGGVPLRDALATPPDFEDASGKWLYRHRHSDQADVYFVAGSGSAECTFRISGKEPETLGTSDGPYPGRRCLSIDERRTHRRQARLARFRQRLCCVSPPGRRRCLD